MTGKSHTRRPDLAFILLALVLAAPLGTALGLSALAAARGFIAAAWTLRTFTLHGQLQVYGFLGLFTMGVAMMMWPKVLGTRLVGGNLAVLSLIAMVAGIAFSTVWPASGALLETISAALFALVLMSTRRSSRAHSPLTREQSLYLLSGTLWLIVSPGLSLRSSTLGLETALWGFLGLYVAGLGLRLHPGMLGIKGSRPPYTLPALVCWNLGVGARWLLPGWTSAILLVLGVSLFLTSLGPFRTSTIPAGGMPWLRLYVRLAYTWLAIATLLTAGNEVGVHGLSSASRHAFATGFVLTMVAGMGLRMLPAFEGRRLRGAPGPWMVLLCLTLGGALRIGGLLLVKVGAQSLGATLQTLGIAGFVVLLLSSTRIALPRA